MQCQEYSECAGYKTYFVDQGKCVFGVEYSDHGGNVCSEAKEYGMIEKYESGGWHNCFN